MRHHVCGDNFCWCEIQTLTFALQNTKLSLVYYCLSLWSSIDDRLRALTHAACGAMCWEAAGLKGKQPFSCCQVQTWMWAQTQTYACFPNDYGDWCKLPQLIIRSHITPKPPAEKGSCTAFTCVYSHVSSAHFLQNASSGFHANPAVQIQIGDWLFSLHVVWGSGI